MRIVIIGQAAFGQSVLEALVKNGEEVAGVFCPPDREGRPHDPIKTAALEKGVPVLQFKRMRDREAIGAFKNLMPDLCVMAFVTDIVPMDMLRAPSKGTIQYHPSLLPKHRGPSSINWPIIQGETKTGLTIFWPDEGLDTGPILLQKEVAIGPDDTLGSLYFDKLFPLGVQGMVEAVELVRKGKAPKREQDHSQATYEGWCKAEQAVIDWSKPLADVYNLVRGCDPSPGANTTLDGKRVSFYSAERITGGAGPDVSGGHVAEVMGDGFRVAAMGGSIVVRRVQPEGGKKMPAGEWAASAALKPGMRFGS
ncbi:MAG: methionyl-tRNA formyltransferase [SAR202 cluster bacterium]|nr:methionyl-tRNA formyltransferase [SAR202 cluster bacterium]